MERVCTSVLCWMLLCASLYGVLVDSSTTGSTPSEARAPIASNAGAEYQDSFENIDATSRGLLFPGLSFELGEQEDVPSTNTAQSEPGGQAERGRLTQGIGKQLDKFGNEIRMLCWTDDMCAVRLWPLPHMTPSPHAHLTSNCVRMKFALQETNNGHMCRFLSG